MSHNPVIAVAGGSASGKSTLVKKLHQSLSNQSVILSLDRYYHDLSHLTFDERAKTNFDHPDAMDITLYVNHLKALSSHEPIQAPVYDFTTHTRSGEETIHPQSIILTEGILLLAIPAIRDCIEFSIFLDVSEEVRLERKIKRDVEERGRTEDYARHQFYTTVKPIHDELVTSSIQFADIILDGTLPIQDLFEKAISEVTPLIR